MTLKHLFSILNVTRKEIEELFSLALDIEEHPSNYANSCKSKILASLFFEPSTRTRLSFESAMHRLGGDVIGFATAKISSAAKGETIADTIRVINSYADIAVIRHYIEGIGEVVKKFATIPFISGGTGSQEHPTQALLDLYTINKEFGEIKGLTIGLMGDLKYGRTIPSLLYGLAKFNNIKIWLISPEELKIRRGVEIRLRELGVNYTIVEDYREAISELDVLYVTRIQKERFPDPLDYERLKGSYRITLESLNEARKHLIILHPLPRVDEIAPEVDDTKHARYFQQAKNGVWLRMALLYSLLKED